MIVSREIRERSSRRRIRLNADDRSGLDIDRETVEVRRKFYRSLNKLNRAALCLSGGGIRSATFCLGVIQALARYNVNSNPPQPRRSPVPETPSELALRLINSETVFTSEAGIASVALQAEAAELEVRKRAPDAAPPVLEKSRPATPEELGTTNSLLGRLHYLSTVSGGGYIGSWLSSWRKRNDFKTILDNLTTRPGGPDVEPPEISWLRAYSNYLTPRLGIGSADTWAAVAIVVRNLVLNWLVIIPVVCLALLSLKFIVALSAWTAQSVDTPWVMRGVARLVGIEGGVVSGVFNLESSDVEASDRRPRHDDHYHEA